MEMNKRYFSYPKQVVFADPDNPGEWLVGIASRDEIICACCGGIFTIDDVIEAAIEDGVQNAIYEYENWIDIAVDISGGELPFGLKVDESGFGIIETCKEEVEEYDRMVAEDEEISEYEACYFENLE